MSLRDRLVAQIAAGGPLTIAQYMTACLHDRQAGYYATRPALGAGGDFITAPTISQMFGELIGLWAIACWRAMGSPAPVRLVEMGPGDGTLMSDLLRAARTAPDFRAAAEIWLVEVSPPLAAAQAERLADAQVRWVGRLEDVPRGAPLILVANEVLDCLPARQFVRTPQGWAERLVAADTAGDLVFALSKPLAAPLAPALGAAPASDIVEISAAQQALGAELGERLSADGGAALLIDYGPAEGEAGGDTFQALKAHRKVDPLACPGEADLTVHAQFAQVAEAARASGARAAPLLTQAQFLGRMGIETRARALAAARPDQSDRLARQFHRLTSPDQMGQLFKVLCLHGQDLSPPGFETAP